MAGTLGIQILPTGIVVPSYSDVLAQLQNSYWSIYGTDAQLTPDTADGQFLAILAQAINDCNNGAAAVYNSFAPSYAQGTGLSSLVKLNGIRRDIATNSQATATITGVYGTPINNGVIGDDLNLDTQWALPTLVTIPESGTIAVTVTCIVVGAVSAGIGTLTNILTPTDGWQSASNTSAATLGNSVEDDAELRQRQSQSTSLPAQTPLENIYAAVANVTGVTRLQIYQNDTSETDGDGIPDHSICVVALGGTALDICTAIAAVKNPGTGTYGNTSEVIIDKNGVPDTINYFPLTLVPITIDLTLEPLAGWVTSTTADIQESLAQFLNDLGIGFIDYLNKLWSPANLSGDAATSATDLTQAQLDVMSATYNITALTQCRVSDEPPAVQDVPIAFNEAAQGVVANITITVT